MFKFNLFFIFIFFIDPFVKVSLLQGGRRVKKKKTSVRKCNCNPTWNEAIIFNVPAAALNACSLEVRMYSRTRLVQNLPGPL